MRARACVSTRSPRACYEGSSLTSSSYEGGTVVTYHSATLFEGGTVVKIGVVFPPGARPMNEKFYWSFSGSSPAENSELQVPAQLSADERTLPHPPPSLSDTPSSCATSPSIASPSAALSASSTWFASFAVASRAACRRQLEGAAPEPGVWDPSQLFSLSLTWDFSGTSGCLAGRWHDEHRAVQIRPEDNPTVQRALYVKQKREAREAKAELYKAPEAAGGGASASTSCPASPSEVRVRSEKSSQKGTRACRASARPPCTRGGGTQTEIA